ncbi:hypothetical protein OPT61_g4964 [Boeremia exigua]|uniref:Uncharacterized protein n=1 Tax=Boeremia exigua TaxID=749465 RepID=A0ACC2IC46_9PLEO|nr:hypothetical protein OPT61_g4964 [Boeremia exigua]
MALRRLAQEHANIRRDPLPTCSAGPASTGNPLHWDGYITGPPDTRYAQEKFFVTIVFPEEYPMKPFQLFFTTSLSHPSVNEDGLVRLPELEEKHWSPAQTVRSILMCLQVMLSDLETFMEESDSEVGGVEGPNNAQKRGGVQDVR